MNQDSESPGQGHDDALSEALESTLGDLNRSVDRMEAIIGQLESGEADWEEAVRLISEANDLAMSSSQKLDRIVQDVVYGSGESPSGDADLDENQQETLDLP